MSALEMLVLFYGFTFGGVLVLMLKREPWYLAVIVAAAWPCLVARALVQTGWDMDQ